MNPGVAGATNTSLT
jgi:hypothetical protein